MKKNLKNKKAVSPVVATVLLISIVIVLGLIIFLWMRSITEEAVTKFGNENIELACKKIEFDASYSYPDLIVSNLGTVPIYKIKLKIFKSGSHTTKELDLRISGGKVVSEDISGKISGAEKILIIPVLLGNSNKGQVAHVCDDRFGKEIIL